jgi:hypothetical protein
MALFGGGRDISLFKSISRELVNNIIEQEIGYYKITLPQTTPNIYNESLNKSYIGPVLLKCLLSREPQSTTSDKGVPDRNRNITVAFLKADLITYQLVPEKGDIVMWNQDYYEVNNQIENQLIVGKDPDYKISPYLDYFGSDFSIVIECHYTRIEKLNLSKTR